MPEINNSLAMQVNANPLNLQSTLGTISQIQLAQAHAGLYGLQAQQEARKLAGLAYLQTNPNDYSGAIQRGLDPSVGNILQTMGERERSYSQTPGNIAPESYSQLTAAGRNRAETAKIGVETDTAAMGNKARIAQSYLSNPTDENWQGGITAAKNNGYLNTMQAQQLLAVRDPQQRSDMARAWVGAGVSPSEFTAPHNVEPTAAVTTRAGMLAPPTPIAQPMQGGMVAPGEKILGGAIVKDNGVPVPNQQVASRFGVLPPAMTPGQKQESTTYGEQLAKVLPTLADKADQSQQANFTLDQMRNESATWNMGKGGTALMTAQQYLKPLANSLGSTVFDKPVADFESFQKNTGTLVRQAVKEVSSRAAVQEFNLIQNQLPSADMSRRGFNQIADQFQAVNDFNIAKHQAAQAWLDKTGSMNKFEAEWNKSIKPGAFLVARLPPDQLGALRANLQRTPEGRATLRSITTQLKWAHDHNLDQLIR
ncbi:MAG: hypothetical protein KGL39_30880 [Patescibacteria group bacterium]|nr:hypothetical protein [Patescibacteria group bacterium]